MAKNVYKLTTGDKAIFDRARKEDDPNWITNYYLRSADSGTWWRHISQKAIDQLTLDESRKAATKWQDGYNTIHTIWEHLKCPDLFAPKIDNPQEWESIDLELYPKYTEELRRIYRVRHELTEGHPVFHHPHGIQLLPWQLQLWKAKQAVTVNVGGLGSSKTWGKLLCMLVRAVTLPGYIGMVLAPYSRQAEEGYKQISAMLMGTYFEKFMVKKVLRPNPRFVFNNDVTGETTIEFFPALDGTDKFLTLTADEAMVDQAEMFDDLDTLISDIGTRLRGMVRGRPRVGQISLIANSSDNPQLWDWVDDAETDPDFVWAYSPHTFENTHLTINDFIRFEKQVGKDAQSRKVKLLGSRPIGSGEHFPLTSIAACKCEWLDDKMNKGLARGDPLYKKSEAKRVDVHNWELPYEPGHTYILAADPGWGNPPFRNAAALMVWDITDFPRTPAILTAFDWVFGYGSPNPWLNKFAEYTMTYHTMSRNGYDATGLQSGYERLPGMSELMTVPIALSGQRKYVYLTLTKKFCADGLFQIPNIIHIFSQMSKYRLPDEHLRQDLVMTLLITSALLEPLFYVNQFEGEEIESIAQDRYHRSSTNRYDRRGKR